MIIETVDSRKVIEICGFRTRGMLDYLERSGAFVSEIKKPGIRGKKREYTFRDVMILKSISALLRNGASIAALKTAFDLLRSFRWTAGEATLEDSRGGLKHLIISGDKIYFSRSREELIELTYSGQMAFSFMLDLDLMHAEVQREWRQFARL